MRAHEVVPGARAARDLSVAVAPYAINGMRPAVSVVLRAMAFGVGVRRERQECRQEKGADLVHVEKSGQSLFLALEAVCNGARCRARDDFAVYHVCMGRRWRGDS